LTLLQCQTCEYCRLRVDWLVGCRALADIDADGRVDRREFSIAMYLIKQSLHGHHLPPVLPSSLKVDPVGVQTCPLMSDWTTSSMFGMPCSAVRPLTPSHGWSLTHSQHCTVGFTLLAMCQEVHLTCNNVDVLNILNVTCSGA